MISSFPPSMGWHKIKEHLCYNFRSVATKQHMASMVIDQQQTATETLQKYIERYLDLLLKSSSSVPHQTKDLAHITHFIHNLHNQKLQHYVLGKNPTSDQNAIMLAQKKDAELHIIEGLHCCNIKYLLLCLMYDDNSIYMFKLNIYCMIYILRNLLYYSMHILFFTTQLIYDMWYITNSLHPLLLTDKTEIMICLLLI